MNNERKREQENKRERENAHPHSILFPVRPLWDFLLHCQQKISPVFIARETEREREREGKSGQVKERGSRKKVKSHALHQLKIHFQKLKCEFQSVLIEFIKARDTIIMDISFENDSLLHHTELTNSLKNRNLYLKY